MPTDDEIRELIIKKSRRDLLHTLKMWYPGAADFVSLRLSMPDVDEGYLRKDIAYLIDKGYVVWHDSYPNMTWSRREFRLTALGVETADRINKDPALQVHTSE